MTSDPITPVEHASLRLVASMIVRNEINRFLPLAVEHLLTYCDEVRVLDDGSDDGTYEWLVERDGVEVFSNPGPAFFEHEGRARQNLLDWTFAAQPDYVLAIDADEFVGDPFVVREVLKSVQPVYLLSLEEVWKVDVGGLSIRNDGLWKPRKVPVLYAPPERPRGARQSGAAHRSWRIMDRQLACGREPMAVIKAAARAPLVGTSIFHFGWMRESERHDRAERYAVHDGGKFHQNRHLQSILFPDDKVGLTGRAWPVGLREISSDLIEYAAR